MAIKGIEANKVNSAGLLEISENTTVKHLFEIIGKKLAKEDVSKDNRLKENWITTIKYLREVTTPDSWTKWKLLKRLAELRLRIHSEKGFLIDQSLLDSVYYVADLSDMAKCESFKHSFLIFLDLIIVEGIEANVVNCTGLLEISDNTNVNHLLEIIAKELAKVLKDNGFKENWITTVKYLREVTSTDSWTKWNMPTKLAEELRLRIRSEKGFLVDQSLRDLVCYVVDLSDVPKCGSFNPYGNEQMAEGKVMLVSIGEDFIGFDFGGEIFAAKKEQTLSDLEAIGYSFYYGNSKWNTMQTPLKEALNTLKLEVRKNPQSLEMDVEKEKEKKRTTLVQDTREIKKMKMSAYSIDSTHHFDLSFPGLSSQNSTCLYFRQPAIHLIGELSQDIRAMMIQGPPGSGKSSITWAWACEQDYVCWIHLDELKGTVCWKDASDSWSKATYSNDSLSAFVDSSKSRVLILDGIVKEKHEILLSHAVANWLDVDVGRKLIIVCSLQYVIKTETLKVHNYKTFQMPSWSLEEYTSAYSHVMMKHSITTEILPENEVQDEDEKVKDEKDKDKEKLQDKFFVAGGSARWMFQFTVNEVIADIEMHVSRIGSDLTLLMNGLLGERSNTSISHLFCVFNTKEAFIVSEFATRSIAEKCEAAFLIQARNSSLAISNPTFDGWIFEAEFIYKLRSKEITVLFESSALALPVASKYRFCNLPDIVDVKLPASLDNVWFVPSKWNQACFDVVQALPDGGFRFIQVTKSLEHTLKLKYIVLFLNRFIELKREVKALEIWFVVPNEPKYDTFRPKIAEGNLGVFRDRLKKNGDLQYFLYGFERL
jgi:hypothetical protein